eukprot:TRINITY_DN21238_c0_g1_i1.p1 TRINITY_DN21238_c0_g1~~TRINITY_DN21238_c0_g1_i1.p1  ORF type:complete len:109 (-),score=34.42 TRINITY_DN21238_c0_g1_i1:71-397(-)
MCIRDRVLEVVLHGLFLVLYGRNVAWCYKDYSDEYLSGCVRIGHGAAWWVMGLSCLLTYPMLREWTSSLLEMHLWDVCAWVHNLCVALGVSTGAVSYTHLTLPTIYSV